MTPQTLLAADQHIERHMQVGMPAHTAESMYHGDLLHSQQVTCPREQTTNTHTSMPAAVS
jgi:hypothetical protein